MHRLYETKISNARWIAYEAVLLAYAREAGLPVDTIEKKLGASWVKEDSLVPIQTRKKIPDLGLFSSVSDL